MGRRQAVRHSTLTAAFTGSNPVGLVGENMLEKPILLKLRNDQCQFYIGSPKGIEFYCYPKYITEFIYNMLLACLDYLQTGAAAVNIDCGGPEYTFVFSKYMVHIIDTSEYQIKMYNFLQVSPLDVCKNILQCYYDHKSEWVDVNHLEFSNMEFSVKQKEDFETAMKKKLEDLAKDIDLWLQM